MSDRTYLIVFHIDDELNVLGDVKDALEDAGYQVLSHQDLDTFEEKLRELVRNDIHVPLFIYDRKLATPEGESVDVKARLADIAASVMRDPPEFIMYSALGDTDGIVDATRRVGYYDYIIKDKGVDALVEAVNRFFREYEGRESAST